LLPPSLLTWHPPVVTGFVHLGPRLSANYFPLSPLLPLCPPSKIPTLFPVFPEPNVHLIKARLNPLPSIQNNTFDHFRWFLAVLEFSSVGPKFPPTSAWHTLCDTEKKLKILKFQ
jgi:hypothetical protein